MGRLVSAVAIVALLVGGAAGYLAGRSGWALAPRPAAAADECFTFAETAKGRCPRHTGAEGSWHHSGCS